jgi:hypothetical protein
MRVYVVRKWPLRGRSRFVCWNITWVSLWLLCNVHFVQSTQRSRQQTTIRAWYKQFTETGCLCKQKSSGGPLTALEDVERVLPSFLHSPKKWTGTTAKELPMSKTTVWRVQPKRLVFKPYRIQMVQQLDKDRTKITDARGPLTLRPVIFFFGYMSKTGYSSHHCRVTSLT